MSNIHITYLVGAGCALIGVVAFVLLVIAPAVGAYRRPWEKVTAIVLSMYVLAALVGVGVLGGLELVLQWPRIFH